MNNRASKSQCMNFCLLNDLLLEIFYRLPNFESIVQCKSVCKLWLKLVAEPGFDTRYIAYRIKAHSSNSSERDELHHPHIFYFPRQDSEPFIYPNHSSLTCLHSMLSFILAYGGVVGNIVVKSWCNDLVLCTRVLPKELELYICNPRTGQYIQLSAPSKREPRCIVGFTWDPYYMFDKETGQVTLNTNCRYCVCYAVPGSNWSSRLKVEVFSSETRVWRKAYLCTPISFNYISVRRFNCFTYKGMLHFCSDDAIVGFDPYNIDGDSVIHGHIIHMPPCERNAKCIHSVAVGVFCGKLHLVEYESRFVYPLQNIAQISIEQSMAYGIKVWELKNYNTGEWNMKHMTYLHDFVSEDSILIEYIKRGFTNSRLLHIYPNDDDIVLFFFCKLIVECNLKTKTVKKVFSFRKYLMNDFSVAFSWWPSPLPASI